MKHRKAFALFSFVLLSACSSSQTTPWSNFAKQKHPWGYYSGPVDTRWDTDGRTMTLLNELRYVDPKGVTWIAPAGSRIDGASIPRSLWSFMGGPFEGKYRNASVLHDVSYDLHDKPPKECDLMFYNAMRCSGVGAVEAKTMYYSLLRFGRHWRFAVRKARAAEPGDATATRSSAVNPGDVDAIEQWVKQNNPSLEQIDAHAVGER